jgi:hypothetical protein
MNKIFIPISTDGEKPIYVPLLKIGHSGERDYLLKHQDRRKVRAVYDYLDDKGLEVFLGGDVVRNRLQNRRYLDRPYNYIDMIAVGDEPKVANVFYELTESRPDKMPFNYSRIRFKVDQKSVMPRFDPKEIEGFWITLMNYISEFRAISLSILTDKLFKERQMK